MDKFNSMHAKALYLRFAAIYDHKFVKSYHEEEFKSLWENEWCFGLQDVNVNTIKEALDYCRKNVDWPPSISEFIKICESHDGFPSLSDCLKAAMKREFNHPLVLMCYQAVGNWAMKNETEKVLDSKFKSAYADSLTKFRENKQSSWRLLEAYNQRPKEIPAPSKIPTTSESKAFRECMSKCQEILKSKKIAGGGKTYKEFDENKIKKGHKEFSQAVFDEYKAYLMSIPETETMILPPVYLMDRNRFLNMREQPQLLRDMGYIHTHLVTEKSSERPIKSPSMDYKSWVHDK
jgi:hypothetical protein